MQSGKNLYEETCTEHKGIPKIGLARLILEQQMECISHSTLLKEIFTNWRFASYLTTIY